MLDASNTGGILRKVKWKLSEIYEYRNFIRAQVSRKLFGHYKNSYLGFAWNFLTPLMYLVLCYIVFIEIRGNKMENFLVFVSSGVFIFSLLSSGITSGGSTFTGNSGMIKKMYFPKEILVISSAISHLIVMAIGYIFVIIAVLVSGCEINVFALLFVPIIWVLALVFFMGCSFLFGSLAVYVRDVQYLLSSMSMVFFVCTPLRRPISSVTGILADIYLLNPLTYFVEPMHQIFYSSSIPDLSMLAIAAVFAFLIFIIGYVVFLKLKHGFVERF